MRKKLNAKDKLNVLHRKMSSYIDSDTSADNVQNSNTSSSYHNNTCSNDILTSAYSNNNLST